MINKTTVSPAATTDARPLTGKIITLLAVNMVMSACC